MKGAEEIQCLGIAAGLASLRTAALLSVFPRLKSLLGFPARAAVVAVLSAAVVFGGGQSELTSGVLALSGESAWIPILRACVWNVAVGILIAAPFSFLLEAIPMAARLLDTLRGSQFAEQLLPGSESRSSSLEVLAELAIPVLLFSGGLYRPILARAFGEPLLPGIAQLPGPFSANELAAVTGSALSIESAVRLVSPAIAVLVVFELAAAVLCRLGQRLPLSPELLQARLLLGLACFGFIVCEVLPAWLESYAARAGSVLGTL